jgi:hypothetical protein
MLDHTAPDRRGTSLLYKGAFLEFPVHLESEAFHFGSWWQREPIDPFQLVGRVIGKDLVDLSARKAVDNAHLDVVRGKGDRTVTFVALSRFLRA